MAAKIAHHAPGYGNPWHLPLRQWWRILEVLGDVQADQVATLAAGVSEGTSQGDNTMRQAVKIARTNERRERRLQIIRGYRGRSKSAR